MANTVKKKRGRPATGQKPKQYFRMAEDEYALVERAAEIRADGNTSEFIRRTMLATAKRVLNKSK